MAPTGCAIPGCTWNTRKRKTDPRHLFQVVKFIKGKEQKEDMKCYINS